MLVRLLLGWIALAVAFWLTAWLLSDVDIEGGVAATLWVAALFGIVNALLGPILRLLALPITVLTLGLFALVVNAAILGIVAALSDNLTVDGFFAAVLAAILISVISAIVNFLLASGRRVARADR